ncbi:Uncharacterized protein Rs2_03026 [Raphanus sativus]|nr:Uncharacterized protein Rs2_03026 [Raphanus sativus]
MSSYTLLADLRAGRGASAAFLGGQIPVETSSVLTCCSSMRISSSGNDCLMEVSTVAYESFTLLTDLKAGCCSNTEEVRFLSWTITEFSVSVRDMQENNQVMEFQQRKCCVIFEISSNLARVS